LSQFLDSLDGIDASGEKGICGGSGTGTVWYLHDVERRRARYIALVKPWEPWNRPEATFEGDSHKDDIHAPFDGKIALAYLNEWGLSSLFNYRIYHRISEGLPQAKQDLSSFYKSQYGWDGDVADKAASISIERMLVDALRMSLFSDWKQMEENNLDEASFAKNYRAKLANHETIPGPFIHKAILHDMKELIQDTPKEDLAASEHGSTRYQRNEPLIIFGLDDAEMTKLLIAKGADVNAPNWFGKTALMYASQWNMPQIVKILIEAHADVNATIPSSGHAGMGCEERPSNVGDTALVYAAKSASLPVIKELLDAGADKSQKNAKTDFNYALSINPNLKGDNLEIAKKLLTLSEREEGTQISNTSVISGTSSSITSDN
jgi:hypothetical protein